jgi:DNA-binding MarR family transcriptional regulator
MGRRADDQLARAWHELMNRYHRVSCVLDRALEADHGITGSEFAVLEQLAETDDCSLRMHELGEHAHLTQSALSRLVARLEQDGLLERKMCVDDRRSVWVALTAKGRARYDAARPTQREVLRTELAGVPA